MVKRRQLPEDLELMPLDSEERQLTRAEVQMQLATAARGILRPSRDEDDWKKKRRQPKVGRRLQFHVPKRPRPAAKDGEPGNASVDSYAANAPLHLTETERGMVEGYATLGMSGDSHENNSPDGAGQHDSSSEGSRNTDEDEAIAKAMQVIGATTEINPVTLTFVDSDMEQAYVHFAMSQQGFIAGKIYAFLAGVIAVGLLFPYFNFEMTPEKWTQTTVVILFTGVSIGWLMLGLMFLKVLLPMRELIFFLAVATHWPAFATATILSKVDGAYRYSYTTLCFFFCCFIAQPRFVGMFFFLTVTPIATCFIATFTSTHYWEQHSRFEMLYWLMPLFPLFMLRIFERRSREAFVENRRGEAAMEVLAQREAVTRRIIARFFPVTASQRLLATRGMEPSSVFPGTALVMVAVAGFTEWAAQTSAEMVVSRVAGMFVAMERLARRYGVEKVTTLGDMYLGAAFPTAAEQLSSHDATGNSVTDSQGGPANTSDVGGLSEEATAATRTSSFQSTESVMRGGGGGSSTNSEGSFDLGTAGSREVGARASLSATSNVLKRTHGCARSQSSMSDSDRRRADASRAVIPERCHKVLRFATAVRHHRETLPTRIGVHVGTVIGGFVGIQPPKYDLFGAAVERVKELETRGRARRVHASLEMVEMASELGEPSADFDASDAGGQIFSSWRTRRRASPQYGGADPDDDDGGAGEDDRRGANPLFQKSPLPNVVSDDDGAEDTPATMQATSPNDETGHLMPRTPAEAGLGGQVRTAANDPPAAADDAITEVNVEDQSLLLCAYVARFGEVQRDKAMRGFETRDSILRRNIARAMAGALTSPATTVSPAGGTSATIQVSRSSEALRNSGDPSPALRGRVGPSPGGVMTVNDPLGPAAVTTSAELLRSCDNNNNNNNSIMNMSQDLGTDNGSDLIAPSEQGSNHDADELVLSGGPANERVPLNSPEGSGDRQHSAHHQYGGALGDDDVLTIVNPGDEQKLYTFNLIKMIFDDPQVEAQYRRQIAASSLNRDVYILFAIMAIYVLAAAVTTGCNVPTANRVYVLITEIFLGLHMSYLYYVGTQHGWNLLFVMTTYSTIAWLSALLYRDECDHVKEEEQGHVGTASNIIAMWFLLAALSPAFSMDVPMWRRYTYCLCHTVSLCLAILVRRAWIQDEVLIWDGLWACFALALLPLSVFLDISMRAGFQATMRRRALQSNRAEQAERTTTALEMMVPAFVVERLLKAARRGARRTESGGVSIDVDDTSSDLSVGSGATRLSAMSGLSGASGSSAGSRSGAPLMGERTLMKSDAAHAMLTRRSEQVWPYPRSVVMFVSFAPPVLTYEAISDTVTRIEAVARGRSIQKVKTIGTTVLLVAGIDGSLQFEDAAVNAVEAALEIQRRVFPARQAEGWWHRVGVHSGPIFGAVIGSQGLAFDIYGDTVTTAAAVAGSAPENTVRCTGAVRQVLPMDDVDLGFVLAAQPLALEIRGKGAIQVFGVHERAVGAAGPRPPGAMAAGADGNTRGDAAGVEGNSPRSMPSSDSDERVPGSVIADSIRSSLRSAAMLPSAAAPVDGLLESGFMSVDGAASRRGAATRFPDEDSFGNSGGDDVGKGFTPSDERTTSRNPSTVSMPSRAGTAQPAPAGGRPDELMNAADSASKPVTDDAANARFSGAAAFAYDDEIDGFSDED